MTSSLQQARSRAGRDIARPQIRTAHQILERSASLWGPDRSIALIGRDPSLVAVLTRLMRFAAAEAPVLITGETGTGKELFARALFVSGTHHRRRFLAVNCAQYSGNELVASELFGHTKGSFTGAVANHRGVFEEADGGCVFLDEIGDLPLSAQSMLLRVLSEGEVVPVGGGLPRRVDVRVIAATSRDLRAMITAGRFREDLYFRLRQLRLHVPALRERGDDWKLILEYYLNRKNERYRASKRFAEDTVARLDDYLWPGNVREVRSLVETGFHVSEGELITDQDVGDALEGLSRNAQLAAFPTARADAAFEELISGQSDFWSVVHRPFLERELNRAEARTIIERGLKHSKGSYKRLLPLFGMTSQDYLKFMDFLRHHRLKPAG